MDGRVFISYSNLDAAVANAICAAIEASGRKCWIAPRDIQPSSEWAEQIIDGINAANVMVMVFSSASNRSPQVRREVERAINREMPVIPFRIEKVLPVKSLEYFLSSQHWFDAFEGPIEPHIDRLCAVLASMKEDREEEQQPEWRAERSTTIGTPRSLEVVSQTPESTYREDDLAFMTRELARHIGPIARYLVDRASAASPTPSSMIETLAAEFTEPKERAAFTAACRQRLGL